MYKASVKFMTNMQKLHRGIWPWTKGLKSRLPLHYKIRYTETWMKTPEAVHYKPDSRKYVPDADGLMVPVQNIPLPITFPVEADEGLWGGEGFIAGLKKRERKSLFGQEGFDPYAESRLKKIKFKPRTPKIWKPYLTTRVFYSEILGTYIETTVTLRTLELIDQSYGFDHYILKTHQVDLRSQFGMTLKREMLVALAKKSFHPNDLIKQNEIYDKYKQYEIPLEEAEWVGLTLQEAERKQHEIEEAEKLNSFKPLKINLADKLLAQVKEMSLKDQDTSSTSWLKKISPFKEN